MKDFNEKEMELIKKAISFLKSHQKEAEDELDEEISPEELHTLEDKLYSN